MDQSEAYFNEKIELFAREKDFQSLRGITVEIIDSDEKFDGRCELSVVGEYYFEGKMRLLNIKVHKIFLTRTDRDIMHTFLHELSHAMTPYCERKVKNEWIRIDHSHYFYENFLRMTQLSHSYGLTPKEFTLQELKRKDDYKLNLRNDFTLGKRRPDQGKRR
jgi:hypothetical protein